MPLPPTAPAAPDADPAPQRRQRRGGSGLTVTDLARIAGVSPMSVSRALNAPHQVSDEIRAKVQAAVAATGYVANRVAGSLASRRSRLIGTVLPSLAGSVFEGLVQALIGALGEAGYQVMLGQSGYGVQYDDRFLDALIGRRPDGIVLCGVRPSPDGVRRLQATGLPVVETWDMVAEPIDLVVGFSHERIATAVAQHFLALGRSAFAFAGGDHPRAGRRGQAFAEAIRADSMGRKDPLPVCLETVAAPGTVGAGRSALQRILAQQPHTDAIFCSSDMLALGMITEARARRIAVPEQLAIVGFGDASFAADVDPPLSTVRIDAAGIGHRVAQALLDRIDGREVADPVIDVGFELVLRATA